MKKMILAGGSGLLGGALTRHFERRFEVVILTRAPKGRRGAAREAAWDARTVGPWATELEGAEVIINLTGRTVDCRYNARNRAEIMQSRVESTRVIGEAIARCEEAPRIWLNASTATIYKHNFGQPWDECGEIGSTPEAKDHFSVEVAKAWEEELNGARTAATRKIALRTAMVLGAGRNSVFPVLRRLVRLGLGGKMGSGRQYVSWIHEADFCRAIEWLIDHGDLSGVFNICAPHPLSNAEMMRTLREMIGAPFGLPGTEWMLELGAFFLGTETELILKSRRVVPARLLASGFSFRFPSFGEAVKDLHLHLAA